MLLNGTGITKMKLLNKVSKFLENENTIFNLREEIKKLQDELKYTHERYDDSIELNESEERRFQDLLNMKHDSR